MKDDHFVTTNQLSFVDHHPHRRSHCGLGLSKNKAIQQDLSVSRSAQREHSQSMNRYKSPNMLERYKIDGNIVCAGVRNMNPSLYQKPMRKGSKNKSFNHPSLKSNSVFYETSPNMRDDDSERYLTTSQLMHNLGKVKNNQSVLSHRMFQVNGKIAERITRKNNCNTKNMSSFEFSHNRKGNTKSEEPTIQRKPTFKIREVTQFDKGAMEIWELKKSPKNNEKKQETKESVSNLMKTVNKFQKSLASKAPPSQKSFPEDRLIPVKKSENPTKENKVSHQARPMTKIESTILNENKQIQNKNMDFRRYSMQSPTFNPDKLDFHHRSPPKNFENPPDETNTVFLDLCDKAGSEDRFPEEDLQAAVLSNAFEKHQERQEKERYTRYVTNFRNDMKIPSTQPSKYELQKEMLTNKPTPRTNGVTLEFSGDPRQIVHQSKSKNRNIYKELCYRDIVSRQNANIPKVDAGTILEIHPDEKFTRVKKMCEDQRKSGILDQIRSNKLKKEYAIDLKKAEQQQFNKHWDEVNKRAAKIERSKKMAEVNFMTEERHKLEAKKLRRYAEDQIEKQRAKRVNQKLAQKYMREGNRYSQQKNEIKMALETQMREKRQRAVNEKNKQRLVINSCRKNVISTPRQESLATNRFNTNQSGILHTSRIVL
ncbi:unnamed protein product [Moneuplotes crassus]|uniref:Uncharacterized protein n=1 Tax=Euplotes crassus TaxID=5936 RepID=A0AAD1U742_EUPCR|nr:unnamed protein product [Moneuplotes crassus]